MIQTVRACLWLMDGIVTSHSNTFCWMKGHVSRRIAIRLVWDDYQGCTNNELLVALAPHICASVRYSMSLCLCQNFEIAPRFLTNFCTLILDNGMDDWDFGLRSPAGSIQGLGLSLLTIQIRSSCVWGLSGRRVKLTTQPPFSVRYKNRWKYTSTPYTPVWCGT